MSTFTSRAELDFCIVGAIKAGTSSLFSWLARQGEICAASVKEPHYWCARDGNLPFRGPYDRYLLDLDNCPTDRWKYESLFPSKPGLRGEASTGYVHDTSALERIRAACPDCKLIFVLREPVSRMYAAYRHAVRDEIESAASFDAALAAEGERIAAGWAPLYHYRRASTYSDQLQLCYDLFGRDAVHVLFFEDLVTRPLPALERVARFLGIQPNDWALLQENEGVVPRHPRLRTTLLKAVNLARPVARSLKIAEGKQWGAKALGAINHLTLWKPALDDATRGELRKEFKEEVARVQSILGVALPDAWHAE